MSREYAGSPPAGAFSSAPGELLQLQPAADGSIVKARRITIGQSDQTPASNQNVVLTIKRFVGSTLGGGSIPGTSRALDPGDPSPTATTAWSSSAAPTGGAGVIMAQIPFFLAQGLDYSFPDGITASGTQILDFSVTPPTLGTVNFAVTLFWDEEGGAGSGA